MGRAPSLSSQRIARTPCHEAGWLHQHPEALPELLYNWLRSAGLLGRELESMVGEARPRLRLALPVRLGFERAFRGVHQAHSPGSRRPTAC
jgi:hypothetical protein